VQVARAVEHVDFHQRAALPRAAAGDALDLREHGGFVAHLEFADRRLVRAVEVAAREEGDKVIDGLDGRFERRERGRGLRPDAAHPLDFDVLERDQRSRRHGTGLLDGEQVRVQRLATVVDLG
jgi:hypothetical protein